MNQEKKKHVRRKVISAGTLCPLIVMDESKTQHVIDVGPECVQCA